MQVHRQMTLLHQVRIAKSIVGYYCVLINKVCLRSESKAATLVSHTGQTVVAHTLIPAATVVSHRGQVVVIHAFNPSTREEYKTGLRLSLSLRIHGGSFAHFSPR